MFGQRKRSELPKAFFINFYSIREEKKVEPRKQKTGRGRVLTESPHPDIIWGPLFMYDVFSREPFANRTLVVFAFKLPFS